MKRVLAVLLAMVMVFTSACGNAASVTDPKQTVLHNMDPTVKCEEPEETLKKEEDAAPEQTEAAKPEETGAEETASSAENKETEESKETKPSKTLEQDALIEDEKKAPADPDKDNDPASPAGEGGVKKTDAEVTPVQPEEPEKKTDEDGNLLAPFDILYPEVVAKEGCEYEKDHLLLKLSPSTDGELTDALKDCGFTGLERFLKTPAGDWYRAYVGEESTLGVCISKARAQEDVLLADYDYVYKTDASELPEAVLDNASVDQQWYLKECGIPEAWAFLEENGIPAGGDPSVVVAVIDTGVDYTHPDLKANMWVNKNEIPGNGIDDDGNGYVDDVYGCSTVGGVKDASGDPMDDHGHGTHVAGIVAASNNKEGIVGIAYNCKIMAIKAGQASGYFNQSDIAEAVYYAYNMGADVINMSFGGSAVSIAVEEALQTAYTTSILVASAGNEGIPNEQAEYYKDRFVPNYPAALTYVIGVMSTGPSRKESAFSNWDVYSHNSKEYEVYAPGEGLLSTIPGMKYAALSGTSMAAPVVSATAALLRSYFNDPDQYPSRFITAQICAASEDGVRCLDPNLHVTMEGELHNIPPQVNIMNSLTVFPRPDVALYDYYIFDGDEGDGIADAGETLQIGLVVQNKWGMSSDTVVSIDARSNLGIDNPYVEIIDGETNLGAVGTYSAKSMLIRDKNQIVTGVEDPFVIRISDDCPNSVTITIHVHISYRNGLDDTDESVYNTESEFTFTARKGIVKTGHITEDEVWKSDHLYIITNQVYIEEGVSVVIEEGTNVEFWRGEADDMYSQDSFPSIMVGGTLISNGSFDLPVRFYPTGETTNHVVQIIRIENGQIDMEYSEIINPLIIVNNLNHCTLKREEKIALIAKLNNQDLIIRGTCPVMVDIARNSAFYATENFGSYIGCLFSAGGLSDIDYSEKNLFLYEDNAVQSFRGLTSIKIRSVRKFENHTYLELESRRPYNPGFQITKPTTYNSLGYYIFIDVLARNLGGYLAYINSEEEYAFLSNKNNGAIHDNTWLDDPNGLSVWRGESYLNGIGGKINVNYGVDFIIEYDNTDVSWSQEYLDARIKEIDQSTFCQIFKGNAFISNFNKDPQDWLHLSLHTDTNYPMGMGYNYWGTTDSNLIDLMIEDKDDDYSLPDIVEAPILTTPPEDVWPFVTDAYLLDADGERVTTVGNETVVFVAEFNRDMDTSVDLRVRFGSAEPFAEHEVKGNWVTPRRWEGVYTLETTIENGTQYIRIENGRAADDHWLQLFDDVDGNTTRFAFTIDTTAAQMMALQANATETGVALSWMQDDYETLAGYNVYRSNSEDGLYTKLNKTFVPADETSFFDAAVEPGVVYYYNFTVVLTDMSESLPSGKTSIRTMDTMAPDIYHSPVYTAYTGSKLVVSATVTDNLGIEEVKLYYRVAGETEWKNTVMTANNDRYNGIIPAAAIDLAGLEYYIEAFDGRNYTLKGSAEEPYQVTVQLAVDASAKGDVNGDGIITNLDALLILQAVNDLVNLTEEQFLRADLDDSGELSAAEAMRILQYVSGKVKTILF